jgi:hypothetical protein
MSDGLELKSMLLRMVRWEDFVKDNYSTITISGGKD